MNNTQHHRTLLQYLFRKYKIAGHEFGSLKKLSEIIKSEYQIHISLNTLARLSGVRKDHRKPYIHTLDQLAQAAGFTSYEHFLAIMKYKDHFSWQQQKNELEPHFIIAYTEKAIINNDASFLKELHLYLTKNGCSIDMMFGLGFAILNGLRRSNRHDAVIPILTDAPIYIDIFFELFVDIDYLTKYYGKCMVALSKKKHTNARTNLFANCLALQYEKQIGMQAAYKKRAKKLSTTNIDFINQLVDTRCVFPAARWMGLMLEWCLTNKDLNAAKNIFDHSVRKIKSTDPNDGMIIIAQLSEVGKLLSNAMTNTLVKLYLERAQSVQFERDSLHHAGLNLSLLLRKKFTNPEIIRQEMKMLPHQFKLSEKLLVKKIKKIQRLQ